MRNGVCRLQVGGVRRVWYVFRTSGPEPGEHISSYPDHGDREGQAMAIELVPLCTMRLTAKPPIEIGAGPAGIRMIFEETSVEVHGDRLRGQMEGPLVTVCSSARRARERLTSGTRTSWIIERRYPGSNNQLAHARPVPTASLQPATNQPASQSRARSQRRQARRQISERGKHPSI